MYEALKFLFQKERAMSYEWRCRSCGYKKKAQLPLGEAEKKCPACGRTLIAAGKNIKTRKFFVNSLTSKKWETT